MEESKTSVQGRVIRDLIARFASDNLIGRKLKTGELRKKWWNRRGNARIVF